MADWETAKKQCDRLSLLSLDGFIPMQFTGLKDKNGVEIFEGDIVKCWGAPCGSNKQPYDMIGKFVWETTGFTVAVWHKGEWWAYGKMSYCHDKLKVIGNVYEHPSLIKP